MPYDADLPDYDTSSQTTVDNTEATQAPPAIGDPEKAKKYIDWLANLIDQNKVSVSHTDLKKYDLSTMQDHYRISLRDYEVEVSHSKTPDSGKDSYIILFNNIKQVSDNTSQKVILAYIPLSTDLFMKFKDSARSQLERKRREAEEKRFNAAMQPIDSLLEEMSTHQKEDKETSRPTFASPIAQA